MERRLAASFCYSGLERGKHPEELLPGLLVYNAVHDFVSGNNELREQTLDMIIQPQQMTM